MHDRQWQHTDCQKFGDLLFSINSTLQKLSIVNLLHKICLNKAVIKLMSPKLIWFTYEV